MSHHAGLLVSAGLLHLCRRRIPGDSAAVMENGGIRGDWRKGGRGEVQGGESGEEGVFHRNSPSSVGRECPALMQSHMGLCGLHDNAALQHVPMRAVNISGDFGDAAPGRIRISCRDTRAACRKGFCLPRYPAHDKSAAIARSTG
jgi:hypothetical protein